MTRQARVNASAFALLTILALPSPTRADPKFEYGKLEEVKKSEWKAQVKFGLLGTSGNSNGVALSLSGLLGWRDTWNKFALDAGWAYAYSKTSVDLDSDGKIGPQELDAGTQTTTNDWSVKARYDRFFTTNNSLYLVGFAQGSPPSGKTLIGGGQAGYARQLLHSDKHDISVEVGYDFSYVVFSAQNAPAIGIHSGRLFAGWVGKLSESASANLSCEVLLNLNSEDVATEDGTHNAGPFKDTRINARAGLAAALGKNLALGFGFKMIYDNVPSLRPPGALPFAMGFAPFANRLDTVTEASLIVNFL